MEVVAKKLFITGASGYIGKGVLKEFLKNGWKVVALVREEIKGKDLESLGAEFIVGDLGDLEVLKKGAINADAIIHCARDHGPATTANEKDLKCIELFTQIGNEISKIKPCSFIYTSGCLCLGEGADIKDEFSTITTPHKFGKWRLDHENIIMNSTNNEKDFSSVIVRPSWVYGNDQGYISDWINFCKQEKKIYLIEEGLAFCNFVHIDDLAKLYYLLASKTGDKLNGIYHATDNNFYNYAQIADEFKNKYGFEKVSVSLEEGYKLFGLSAYSQTIDQKMVTKRSLELEWTPAHTSILNEI